MRWFVAMMLLVSIVPGMATAQTPEATPVVHHSSCYDLPSYRPAVTKAYSTIPAEDRLAFLAVPPVTFGEMRPSQLRITSSVTDQMAGALEAMPDDAIPLVVRPYHRASIDVLGGAASITNALANGSMLAAHAYAERYDEARRDIASADTYGRAICGNMWDVFLSASLIPVPRPT